MLHHYIKALEASILWARCETDINVLCLARERMDELLAFAGTLPRLQQMEALRVIDQALPMEWPLWMEACRYEDNPDRPPAGTVLH